MKIRSLNRHPHIEQKIKELENKETEVRIFDTRGMNPYLRSIMEKPLIPGMIFSGIDPQELAPSPLMKIGSLPPHYLVGTSSLYPYLAGNTGKIITDEYEAAEATDVNLATNASYESEDSREMYFDKGIDYGLDVASKTVSLGNAAIPVLSALEAGQHVNLNGLTPGLTLTSCAISGVQAWRCFADEDTCVWKKSVRIGGFLSSVGALAVDLTGQYQGLSATLKLTSAALALFDTANGRAVIIGTSGES